MIRYSKGSLFGVNGDAYLTHSTNCKGVFGAGIALEFKKRWPGAYIEYSNRCSLYRDKLLGLYSVHSLSQGLKMLCLYTSVGYGGSVSHPDAILHATRSSLESFLKDHQQANLHMPKINSGLFRVPWHKTELIIEDLLTLYIGNGHSITVWEQ